MLHHTASRASSSCLSWNSKCAPRFVLAGRKHRPAALRLPKHSFAVNAAADILSVPGAPTAETKQERKQLKDVVQEVNKGMNMKEKDSGMMEDSSESSSSDSDMEEMMPSSTTSKTATDNLKQQAAGLKAVGALLALDLELVRRQWQNTLSASSSGSTQLQQMVPLMDQLSSQLARLESTLIRAKTVVEGLYDCRKTMPMQAQQLVKMYNEKLEDPLEDLPCMACALSSDLQAATKGIPFSCDDEMQQLLMGRTSLAFTLMGEDYNMLERSCTGCAGDLSEYANKLIDALQTVPAGMTKA